MIKTASCPSREELIRLNHGDLPGDHLESVCDHVDACKKCQLILGQLDDPPNEFGKQLAQITPDALENARVAIEAETLKETATSIWGQFSPVIKSKDRQPTLNVPCNLRQYEVLRLIGHGGMGEVYEGRHTNLKRPVALKVIHGIRQDDPVAYEHFLREMETAGQLEHPNLVRAYDAWEHDGCLFLAQELLDGESLQQLASKGPIKAPAEIIAALLGTCRALEQLHAQGFVHRDVKPGNIMRQTDGTIKLIDYGLAIASESGKSAARVEAGTVGYMSPEQAHGTGPIDHRSDIYSTGRVLKYLLSKLPTGIEEPKSSELPEKLIKLADRLTQKDPKDRLQNVYAVIVQLEQLQQPVEPVEATAATSPSPQVGQRRRKKKTAPRKQRTAPSSAIEPEAPPKRRGVIWLVLAALLIGIIGFGAFQIIFNTDRRATVLVENHQSGDVIQITGDDGKVRSVELGDQPKFVVDRGTYALSLVGADSRRLNPANITVTGFNQLTVRIEDRPAETTTTAQANSGQSTRKPFELKMVEIPAGRFVMGASEGDADARANESPQRTIEFASPFRMSTHEITVGQFREFVEATGYRTEAETSGEGGWIASRASSWGEQKSGFNWSAPGYTVADSHPVSMVSHADAVAFCDWLSKRDDRVYRLPTEAEWEYACRAGTTTAYHFPKISRDAYCWSLFSVKDTVRPRPVGTRQPNAWGLYDMSGNVREWCVDWYSENAYQREYDPFPTGPVDGTLRVVRGGCFMDMNAFLRSSHRGFVKPQQALNTQGFRVVEGEQQVATPISDVRSIDQ